VAAPVLRLKPLPQNRLARFIDTQFPGDRPYPVPWRLNVEAGRGRVFRPYQGAAPSSVFANKGA
jgi:hypothetical protein